MVNKPSPFPCPECGADSRILETRQLKTHLEVRRRRECLKGHRFTTCECVSVKESPQRKNAKIAVGIRKAIDDLNELLNEKIILQTANF